MKTIIFILSILYSSLFAQNFSEIQLQYSRVRIAKAEKDSILRSAFVNKNLNYPPKTIFIRVFKSERMLELWAYSTDDSIYKKVKNYQICSTSGNLGPKRRRGDLQIPEGFYFINLFNPVSNFYLSLKINYPNKSDSILGYTSDLGGDIFIHGDCVTIGCIPITNNNIKELYWIAVQAKSSGQVKIPVHIFPMKLTENNITRLKNSYSDKNNLQKLWRNLKEGYDYFEKNKRIPEFEVLDTGYYNFAISKD